MSDSISMGLLYRFAIPPDRGRVSGGLEALMSPPVYRAVDAWPGLKLHSMFSAPRRDTGPHSIPCHKA